MLGNDKNLHQYWSTDPTSYVPYSPLTSMFSTLPGATGTTNLTPVITTPKILNAARNHYNCTTLAGMPYIYIAGKKIMAWTRLAMIDSYNTNTLDGVNYNGYQFFTIFDAALLMDTNWYTFVDTSLVIPTFWG
jgi:hypothetical protein